MKTVLLLLLSTATGIAVGWISLSSQYRTLQHHFAIDAATSAADTAEPEARLEVVGGTEHDFGTMARYTTRRHTYVLRNVGTAPLTIEPQAPTCQCTIVNQEPQTIAPGESIDFPVEWTPRGNQTDTEFRQTAPIRTNDLMNWEVKLTIVGFLTDLVRVVPMDLVINNVSVTDGKTGELRLFGYREKDFDVIDIQLENEGMAKYFQFEKLDIPEEELQEAMNADAGKLIKVKVQPGLPLGTFNEQLILKTSLLEPKVIPVSLAGQVVGDISIIGGREFRPDRNVLVVGVISRNESYQKKIHLLVKGPHRDETEFKIASIDPPGSMKVDLTNRRTTSKSVMQTMELTIDSSNAVNRMGDLTDEMGRIVIETTNPNAKQVQMFVQFAVD